MSDAVRSEVLRRLAAENVRPEWIELVREVIPPERTDQAALFGEELPVGLTLRRE